MASIVEICNIALSQIRAGSINSLNEASLQAQQCRLWYPLALEQILRDAPWQFARVIRPLSRLSDDDGNNRVFNWAYSYQYPADLLRINRLVLNYEFIDQETPGITFANRLYPRTGYGYERTFRPNLRQQVEYEIVNVDGNKVIASNWDELRVDGGIRVDDPNLFDPQFYLALGHLISSFLALPIVGPETGRQLRADNLTIYETYINEAIAMNANEQFQYPADSELVTVRGRL